MKKYTLAPQTMSKFAITVGRGWGRGRAELGRGGGTAVSQNLQGSKIYHEMFTKVTTVFKPVDPVTDHKSDLESSSKNLEKSCTSQ